MKGILVMIAVGCVLLAACVLCADSPKQGVEYALATVSPALKKPADLACGPYFILVGGEVKTMNGKSPVVFFQYTDGNDHAVMLMGRDKFITLVDDSKPQPTAALSMSNREDSVPFHWTIRLSERDFNAARPCLPEPKTEPRKK